MRWLAIWAAGMLLLAAVYTAGWYCGRLNPHVVVERRVDTVFYQRPEPVSRTHRLADISVPLLLFAPPDTVENTVVVKVGPDSAQLKVAIETIEYVDSTYRAQVSGPRVGEYGPQLDWLKQINTASTVTVSTPDPKKRWGIGIQAGYGAVLKQDVRLYPYVGIGVSYSIIRW